MSNAPDEIKRFENGRWVKCPALSLNIGDEFLSPNGKGVYIVKDRPFEKNGKIIIPAEDKPEGPIQVFLGMSDKYPFTGEIMDFLCIGLIDYGDGTVQLRDDELAPGIVFSPVMSKDDLENFCKKHIQVYRDFYEQHAVVLDGFDEYVYQEFPPFWDDL